MNKYQECLENLRNWVLEYFYDEDGLEIGDQCLEDLFPVEFAIIQQAIDKAIKYDDKETPKKPIKEIIFDAYDCDDKNIDFEWERTKCPHCDDDLINEYEDRDFEDYDYCPCCGGRLDWSDE